MAKKHKHEEHVNHERWLVSFADMMTLLFALFVVLYALGQADLEKIRELRQSVQWAFHIEGEGKTKDTGLFENQAGGGDVMDAVPLVTAQDGEMREFLKDELETYEEIAGQSLDVVQTDDSVSFKAPLSDFFQPLRPHPLKPGIGAWLDRVLTASLTFSSRIRIIIETPDLLIGLSPGGQRRSSVELCILRLQTLEQFALNRPEVRDAMVTCEWRRQDLRPGASSARWEREATVTVVFDNATPK